MAMHMYEKCCFEGKHKITWTNRCTQLEEGIDIGTSSKQPLPQDDAECYPEGRYEHIDSFIE